MTIVTPYEFFQVLYLRTDTDQVARLLTNIEVSPGPQVKYGLSCGTGFSWHYAEEITTEPDLVKKVTAC